MTAELTIAVPSKGRLQENANAFFARAGLALTQDGGAREYRGVIRELPGIEVLYLSASEIVARLATGACHFGVTGEDLIREAMADADRRVALIAPLGFGHADVVVATPKGWIDCATMEDLEEIAAEFHARHGRRMRVATKYVNLARRYFAEHGVSDYRIVESLGATEGAPAAGTAEFIVDITTTGATLEANGLKVLSDGVILRSEASLFASLAASWTPEARRLASRLLGRVAAEKSARDNREISFMAEAGDLDALRGVAGHHGVPWPETDAPGRIVVIAPKSAALSLAADLAEAGAEGVSVGQAAYVFERINPLAAALDASLARAAG
ncbi:MAG: ATP phosphoribosyltransferase [Beijerinckiaceae bacterium]